MGLLGRIKQLISENEKPAEVTRVMAPLSGEIVPLDTVPDAVFAGKIVGGWYCYPSFRRRYLGGSCQRHYR